MKILLVVKQKKNVDTFLRTIRILLDRGHTVTVAVQERDERRDEKFERDIAHDRFDVVPCPPVRTDQWTAVAGLLRSLRDCVHYLGPQLREAVKLQARTVNKLRQELAVPGKFDEVATALREIPATQVARLESVMKLAEAGLPTDPLYDEFIRSHAPDVVLASPVIHFGSAQADIVASARRVGIPIWMLLYSWDNLSTKGTFHRRPDLMFVWNEQQRREAEQLHKFPSDRVVVVGAPRFDPFFELAPTMTREEFHVPAGLDPAKPTILYVCSSRFVSDTELPFIRGWLREVRSSRPALRSCNVIIRPHPDVPLLPVDTPVESLRWPANGELTAQIARPFDDPQAVVMRTAYRSSTGLHECIWHSTAVVGLNTSAELEAGIVGRPVFTLVANPQDAGGQSNTLHFHYLLKAHGGFVRAERTYKHHMIQLADALENPPDPAPIRAFIEQFLRPHGLDKPVAPLLADAIEQAFDAHRAGTLAPQPQEEAPESLEGDEPDAPLPKARNKDADVVALDACGLAIHLHQTTEIRREQRPLFTNEAVDWLKQSVGIGDVMYDLGAGMGVYTLLAARHRAALVVAFEAGYASYAQLCDNLLLNAVDGSVIPLPFALADDEALREMKYHRKHQGWDRYTLRNKWRQRSSAGEHPYKQPVCATPLDRLVERYELPVPNHLLISRSSATRVVLAGAPETLRRPTLRSVFMTVDPKGLDGILVMMDEAGWSPAFRRDVNIFPGENAGDYALVGFERIAAAEPAVYAGQTAG